MTPLVLCIVWSLAIAQIVWSWSIYVNVSRNQGNSTGAALAVDGTGRIHLVWIDDSINYPGNNQLFYATSTDNGATWGTPQSIAESASATVPPAIAAAGNGLRAVTWVSGGRTYARVFQSNTWSTPAELGPAISPTQRLSVAINDIGIALVAWSAGSQVERYGSGGPAPANYYYSRWDGSTWSSATGNTGRQIAMRGNLAYLVLANKTIIRSTDAGAFWEPSVALPTTYNAPDDAEIDSQGRLYLTWLTETGVAVGRYDGQEFSPVVQLGDRRLPNPYLRIGLAINGRDELTLAWTETTFAGTHEFPDPNFGPSRFQVIASQSADGQAWSTPAVISEAGCEAAVAAGAGTRFYGAWRTPDCGSGLSPDVVVASQDGLDAPAPSSTPGVATLTPTNSATPTLTPTTATPTATTTTEVPRRPEQHRTLGKVKVYASAFTGSLSDWRVSGTVWIGDYFVVQNASLRALGGILSGTGLVSMADGTNGQVRQPFFTGSFSVDGGNGNLTPTNQEVLEIKINKLAGFGISDVTLRGNVLQGIVQLTANLRVLIPGNDVAKNGIFTVSHTGDISGTLTGLEFDLSRVKLKVQQATLGTAGLSVQGGELQVPLGLGGQRAEVLANSITIQSTGQIIFGSGGIGIFFPNIRVGTGSQAFSIEGLRAKIELKDGAYFFTLAGTFALPGIGPSGDQCKIGGTLRLANVSPQLRQIMLSIQGCIKVPIGSTSFFITAFKGEFTLDENQAAIDLALGIEHGLRVANTPLLSGEPGVRWDTSWAFALRGDIKLFTYRVVDGTLAYTTARGMEGTVRVDVLAIVEGNGRIRIWNDTEGPHLAGSLNAGVRVEKGEVYTSCIASVCVYLPPVSVLAPEVAMSVGEFRAFGERVYGMKGFVDLQVVKPAIFIDTKSNIRYDLGGLKEYELLSPGNLIQQNDDVRSFRVLPQTDRLLIAMAVGAGSPSLSLRTPAGATLTPGSPELQVTTVATQTMFVVQRPLAGDWQLAIGDREASTRYNVVALGAVEAPTVQTPSVSANGDGSFTIGLVSASGTPTSTISLYADDGSGARAGIPIVEGLPLSTTSYRWTPERIAAGQYTIYALVDDPLGAAVTGPRSQPIVLSDTTAPAPPRNVQVRSSTGAAQINWTPGLEPDIAGYRIYYREPGGGAEFITQVDGNTRQNYTQEGLYLNGDWQIAVSAFDMSGNESARTAPVVATIRLQALSLPLLRR